MVLRLIRSSASIFAEAYSSLKKFRRVGLLILFLCFPRPILPLPTDLPGKSLNPGVTTAGEITVRTGISNYATFHFQVPDTVYAVRVSLSGSPADLDLYLKQDVEIHDYRFVDAAGASEAYNESLFITRMSDPPLTSGIYFLDVAYRQGVYPKVSGRSLNVIPFFVTLEYTYAEDPLEIQPGEEQPVLLSPENGMFALLAVDVPPGASVLRLDVLDPSGDVDLLVGLDEPVLSRAASDYRAESYLGKESLIIDRRSSPSLRPGRYYITVTDQLSDWGVVGASILATFSAQVPEKVCRYPPFSTAQTGMEPALAATWEIIGQMGKGSGCVVRRDGLLLTSYHVVQGRQGGISPELYGAVSLAHDAPPEELFRLEAVDVEPEQDVALLKVVSGLYGQPLPADYTFPVLELGDPAALRLGDSLTLIGYPGIGGLGSRPSVSLMRGIVSGFFQSQEGRFIKTDAPIYSGNSGGAAVDGSWRLVGLPLVVMGPETHRLTYILPISDLPAAWLKMLSADDP